MMTHQEARDFQQRLTGDTRTLTRAKKAELQAIRRDILKADGVIWESGGPASKDELVNDILNRRYPLAQVNEATHVLYHAPSTRWEACEHCQARPATETVNTSELRPGDVVLVHGMRVRVDNVRGHIRADERPGELIWSCPGTVLNLDEVLEAKIVPPAYLESYGYSDGWQVLRRDAWTIQGNTLARWTVELPRPTAPQRPGCSTPALHAAGRCVCAGITWTDTAAAEQAAADRQAGQ